MGGHIFISYRSIEEEFARKLANDLQKAGIKLWMDKPDGIVVGDTWTQSIDSALKTSAGLIAVLTTDYFTTSFVCGDELGYAYNNQLAIYPLLLRDVDKKHLPFWLQNRQYLDFRQYSDASVYQELLAELVKHIKQKRSLVADSSAEERYLDNLIRDLSKPGRGVLQYFELAAKTSVYENPFASQGWDPSYFASENQEEDRSELKKPRYTEHFDSILKATEKYSRFVLIGEPGAGKTTTIRKLAWDAAQQRLEAIKNGTYAPIPLLLKLAEWPDSTTLLDFVRMHWPLPTDPAKLLKTGEILLYLDGLNEMGTSKETSDKLDLLREWLKQEDAPQNIIITCRARDYTGNLKLGNLPTVLIEEMDEYKISGFVENYLEEKAEKFLSYFSDISEPIVGLHGAGHWGIATGNVFNTAFPPDYEPVLPIYLQDSSKNSLSVVVND